MGSNHFTDKNELIIDGTILPAESYCTYDADSEKVKCQVISREEFIDDWGVGEDYKEKAREFLEDRTFEQVSRLFSIESQLRG